MSKPIQRATFTPPKLTRKRVWLGAYGGHYDIVVMFAKKPTHYQMDKTTHDMFKGPEHEVIDCLAEQKAGNLVGDMDPGDFTEAFPGLDLSAILTNGRPKAIEIAKGDLIQVELMLPLDEYGRARSIDMHSDWS